MQVICISRGTYAGGRQLAEALAAKLGYECLSREKLADAATDAGIAVGKVEMAVVQRRPLNEWLNIEKERFKAFVAATLSERALGGGLVYHGRHAHVLLAGVAHTMRVRAVMDADMRTSLTMQRLNLSRDKAKRYNDEVDEDRGRWVKAVYGVDWEDPGTYDLVVNLSHVTGENAAAGLVAMAQLPEFQPTPAGLRTLGDIGLAARARLAIANDSRTRLADVQVKAQAGRVLVTYLPRQQGLANAISEIVTGVDGVQNVVCTMAGTSLLWIQEHFDADSEGFGQILDVASRWGAAVQLVQSSASVGKAVQPTEDAEFALLGTAEQANDKTGRGGVLDDTASTEALYGDEGVNRTMARLIEAGRAGGYSRVGGGPSDILASLDRSTTYTLVVVGDMFLSKPESVRKRLGRELVGYLSDKLKVPVVGIQELGERFAFGPQHWLRLFLFGACVAVILGLVFTHQREALAFLSKEGTAHRVLSTACLLALVPLFAYVYGNFARYLLRLLRFE